MGSRHPEQNMAGLRVLPAAPDTPLTGCGKECMGECCLPGASLPAYSVSRQAKAAHVAKRNKGFSKDRSFGNLSNFSTIPLGESESSESSESDSSDSPEARRSFLDSYMLNVWDERVEEGLFRYNVSSCETKLIPGSRGYIAQYNEGRHSKKRPTEFAMDSVMQPFDAARFNFTKIGQKEAMFVFQEGSGEAASFREGASLSEMGLASTANIVAINVSPIDYGHVLLIPRILDHIPQRMDASALLLALRFAAEIDNPCFRLGYNSLGAFATVNHLHFQGYYLQKPYPIESAETSIVRAPKRSGGVTVEQLEGFPVRALVFNVGESHGEAAEMVGAACEALQRQNTPFNIFISASGSRIFLMPQCFAERLAKGEVEAELLSTMVNPAVFEMAGHIIMKRREDFDSMTEEAADCLLAAGSLSHDAFEEVKALCLNAAESCTSAEEVKVCKE